MPPVSLVIKISLGSAQVLYAHRLRFFLNIGKMDYSGQKKAQRIIEIRWAFFIAVTGYRAKKSLRGSISVKS